MCEAFIQLNCIELGKLFAKFYMMSGNDYHLLIMIECLSMIDSGIRD